MTKGFIGKVVDINLSTRQVKVVEIQEDVMQNFLGGPGLGVKILYDEVGPDVDPLGPSNLLIFAAGLLNGTKAPTNGRTEAITKSPYTGIMGRGNFGGWWGPRLKHAGFEAVVVRGKADRPVYILIDDGCAEVNDAQNLWGTDTWETTDAVKRQLGDDVSVLAIGQAGENLVKFSCPVADYDHSPGRSHTGSVMGSKNLKAIAVRGTNEVIVAEPDMFKEAVQEANERIKKLPNRGRELVGSNVDIKPAAKLEVLPSCNFQKGGMPGDSEIWNFPESFQKYTKPSNINYGYHCPLAEINGCNLEADVKEGPYAGLKVGGLGHTFPGWEWGSKCQLKSYPAFFKCRELCNRHGMDQAIPIPFAMELFQRGIITTDDTDGLDLSWGNESAVMEMIKRIAHREGFGDILADGSERAAQKIGRGAEKYLVTMRNHEVLALNPRVAPPGSSLGYLANIRGADDLDTTHSAYDWGIPQWPRDAGWSDEEYLKWFVDWIDMPRGLKQVVFGEHPNVAETFNRDNLDGKAAWVKWNADCVSIYNSLGLCLFAVNSTRVLGPTHFAKLFSAFTGHHVSVPDIMRAGERIFNLMKAYSVREGKTRKDDDWPERFYSEPWPSGPFKGELDSRDMTKRLLDDFYELQGWDIKKGVPTKRKLIELGLGYVADELIKLSLIEDEF